jgi:hypothetical protein
MGERRKSSSNSLSLHYMKVRIQLQVLAAFTGNKGTNWIGGWVSPRARLEVVAKREMQLSRSSNIGCPATTIDTKL